MRNYSFGHGKAEFYPPSGFMVNLWDQPWWVAPAEAITCKIGDVFSWLCVKTPFVREDNFWDKVQYGLWEIDQRLHLWPDKFYTNQKTVYLTREQAEAVVDEPLFWDLDSSG